VNLEESPWVASIRDGRRTGGSSHVGARVTVARRAASDAVVPKRHPACPPCVDRLHRRRVGAARTAGARPGQRARGAQWGGSLGSTSASKTLDAGRKVRCRRWRQSSLAISIFGPETFARGSFLFALPVRAGAAASLGDVARCSVETLHHRW